MTDSVAYDPTAQWLAENFSLETPWRRPAPAPAPAVEPADYVVHAEQAKWRRTRAVARVAGQVAPYASTLLWLGAVAAAEESA